MLLNITPSVSPASFFFFSTLLDVSGLQCKDRRCRKAENMEGEKGRIRGVEEEAEEDRVWSLPMDPFPLTSGPLRP